jgi:hypothetical protein
MPLEISNTCQLASEPMTQQITVRTIQNPIMLIRVEFRLDHKVRIGRIDADMSGWVLGMSLIKQSVSAL